MHTGTVEKPILGHSNSRSTRPGGGKVTGNSQFRGSSTALNKKGDPSSQYFFLLIEIEFLLVKCLIINIEIDVNIGV